jgi:putative transposase
MKLEEGKVYHIYNRGNKQHPIFFEEEDYELFLLKIRKELMQNCEILSYCLMPNHFHLVALVKTNDRPKHKNLNNAIGTLLRSYTRSLQNRENFKGSLFQQKTKAKELVTGTEDLIDYLAVCTHYLHLNPKKAGLVAKMEDWKYSSCQHYMNLRHDSFCNKAIFYGMTKLTEEKFLEELNRMND